MTQGYTITFRDSELKRNTVFFPIESGEDDLTVIQAGYTALVGLLQSLTGSQIIGGGVSLNLTTPVPPAVVANSRNDAGARMSFYNTAGKAYPYYIPAMQGVFLVDGVVDSENTAVANFIAAMTAGFATVRVTDPNFLNLVSYASGAQTTRKF